VITVQVWRNGYAQTASSLDDADRNGRWEYSLSLNGELFRCGGCYDTRSEAIEAGEAARASHMRRLSIGERIAANEAALAAFQAQLDAMSNSQVTR
jgi:hypothetical protein